MMMLRRPVLAGVVRAHRQFVIATPVAASNIRTIAAAQQSGLRWFSENGSSKNGSASGNNGADNQQQQNEAVAASQKRITELEEEVKKLKQEILYCLADQENTRRIAKKDVADARAFGIKEFAKNMIVVADTFEKAIESMQGFQTTDSRVTSFIEGIKATEQNLLKAFKSSGVEPFAVQGEKFDPNFHDALAKVPDPNKPPNTLYKVLRRGWLMNGRVLRAAEVVTTVAPPEIDPAFLERKVTDKVDEADDIEHLKEKLSTGNGQKKN